MLKVKTQIEKVVQLTASLPNDSQLRDDLTGQFIGTLWNGLKHPPISYLGDEFKYRAADGSNNVCDLEVFGESALTIFRTSCIQT
jgi:hypothetical protein